MPYRKTVFSRPLHYNDILLPSRVISQENFMTNAGLLPSVSLSSFPISMLDDRGTYVWTGCPRLLRSFAPVKIEQMTYSVLFPLWKLLKSDRLTLSGRKLRSSSCASPLSVPRQSCGSSSTCWISSTSVCSFHFVIFQEQNSEHSLNVNNEILRGLHTDLHHWMATK